MVIHALQNLEDDDRNRLVEILENDSTQEEVDEAIDLLNKYDSIEYCRELAVEYANSAKDSIKSLQESNHKNILISLVDYMIERVK